MKNCLQKVHLVSLDATDLALTSSTVPAGITTTRSSVSAQLCSRAAQA